MVSGEEEMKNKKSVGIIVFGVLIILGSLHESLGLRLDHFRFLLQPLPDKVIVFRYFVFVIMIVLGLVAGIGVFFLRNIFRKMLLFIGFYNISTYLVDGPFLIRNGPKYIEQQISSLPSVTIGPSLLWITTLMTFAIDLSFAICLIYFFTRPKVKEQFK